MNRIPDDLLQYVRRRKLAAAQKRLFRELVRDVNGKPKTAGEYAEMYARRAGRIRYMRP